MVVTDILPEQSLNVDFGDAIRLRGYDLQQIEENLRIKLYWESVRQTSIDWSIFAHLRNPGGETVAQKDGPAGGRGEKVYPTSLWDAGEVVVDTLVIPLPEGLSAGEYALVVGLYDLATGQRLAVPDSGNNEIPLTTWQYSGP
jgi:hypothetical protein